MMTLAGHQMPIQTLLLPPPQPGRGENKMEKLIGQNKDRNQSFIAN